MPARKTYKVQEGIPKVVIATIRNEVGSNPFSYWRLAIGFDFLTAKSYFFR